MGKVSVAMTRGTRAEQSQRGGPSEPKPDAPNKANPLRQADPSSPRRTKPTRRAERTQARRAERTQIVVAQRSESRRRTKPGRRGRGVPATPKRTRADAPSKANRR